MKAGHRWRRPQRSDQRPCLNFPTSEKPPTRLVPLSEVRSRLTPLYFLVPRYLMTLHQVEAESSNQGALFAIVRGVKRNGRGARRLTKRCHKIQHQQKLQSRNINKQGGIES
jgi:hypothetical protein